MTDSTEQQKIGLTKLREPFPDHLISKLPKPTCKKDEYEKLPKGKCAECGGWHATSKTIHIDYVGHAALTDRLLDADPEWSWEPLAFTEQGLPRFDETGGLWIRLTVCGHTRLGYGNAEKKSWSDVGAREKEVIGDALRNAAMRFGAALELWHKGDLHIEEDNKPSHDVRQNSHKHLPTDGAWESMSDAQQKRLLLIAKKVEEHMAENNIEFAVNILKGNEMTNEEKTALWTRFDSATRTAINAAMGKGSPKRVEELRNAVK